MSNGSKQTQRSRRVQGQHKTQELETKKIKNADGGDIDVKDTRDRENPDDKPAESQDISKALDQEKSAEGGNFKDIRKAINLSDNPAQQQRLQNKLDKLELKKGFKAEKLKQKGLESITKKEFKPKYKEYTRAKLEKEASQVPNRPIKKLEELPEPEALKTGKMSGQQAKSHTKMSGIAKNLGYFLNR